MKYNLINFNELTLIDKYNVLNLYYRLSVSLMFKVPKAIKYSDTYSDYNGEIKFNINVDNTSKCTIEIEYVLLYSYYDKKYINIETIPYYNFGEYNIKLRQLKRLIKIDKILNK